MPDNQKFTDPGNWSLIKRGRIFEAVVPFVGERPLEYFIPDTNNPHTGKTRKGVVVAFDSEFLKGEKKYDVVLGLKVRKVVIITNDKLNHDVELDDISIAKIYSIKEEDKADEWYQDSIAKSHPLFVYLPREITGEESIIDLSSITTVHKNMLLQERQDISAFLPLIDSKISYCFKLGIYNERELKVEDVV